MKSVLLVGLGYFGRMLAEQLDNIGNDVLGIDNDENKVEAAMSHLSEGQIGDATNKEFLESLGVDNFDICFVAIGNRFQESLEVACLLKELNAKKIIAVAYGEIQEKFLKKLGVDEIVNPDKNLARWCSVRFASEKVLDYKEINEECGIFEVACPESWDGKTLIELDVRKKYNISVVGIKTNGKTNLSISTGAPFVAGQILLVIGQIEQIAKVFK